MTDLLVVGDVLCGSIGFPQLPGPLCEATCVVHLTCPPQQPLPCPQGSTDLPHLQPTSHDAGNNKQVQGLKCLAAGLFEMQCNMFHDVEYLVQFPSVVICQVLALNCRRKGSTIRATTHREDLSNFQTYTLYASSHIIWLVVP